MLDKTKANKIEVKITKYNNYITKNYSYLSGRIYIYSKGEHNFEEKLNDILLDSTLDIKVFDADNNIIFERDFEKQSKIVKPSNHVDVVLFEMPKPLNIKNPTVFDMVEKIVNKEVKYRTDDKIDELMHLSKMTSEEKIDLAKSIKTSIKPSTSKEECSIALSRLNGVHHDSLSSQYSKTDMLKMINDICNKILSSKE